VLFALIFFLPIFFDEQVSNISLEHKSINLDKISATHQYADGKHKYKGTVDLPTPCHALRTKVNSNNSREGEASLAFEVVNNINDCEEKVTQQTFFIAFSGNADVSVDATFEGNKVQLALTEIPDGATLDDF